MLLDARSSQNSQCAWLWESHHSIAHLRLMSPETLGPSRSLSECFFISPFDSGLMRVTAH
jgi:hypothetical protein